MIRKSKAARRYAKALFDLAAESNRTEQVNADLISLKNSISASRELARFLPDYVLSRRARSNVLAALFSGKVEPLTFRFIMFLESKRRMRLMNDIIAAFEDICDRAQGIVRGTISFPFPVDEPAAAAVSERIQARVKGALALAQALDRRLIGGFKAQVGDIVYDFSVPAQLMMFKRHLLAT